MGWRRRFVSALAATLGSLCGCFYYGVSVSVAPSAKAPTELSPQEIDEAAAAVARVAEEAGMVPSPSLEEDIRLSEYPQSQKRLVALYKTPRDGPTRHKVNVAVQVEKKTGRFSVSIIDLDATGVTDFTDALDRSLVQALEARFPDRELEIERGTVGPALGP